ncbi:hypothetical protein GW916_03540 [bacterium]|nr:hypothetical protein [bacterium]
MLKKITLLIAVLVLGLPAASASSSKSSNLSAMSKTHIKTLDAVDNSRQEIVNKAADQIEKLGPKAPDNAILPILEALSAAAIYDPGNESAQTAYMLINKFGAERILKLIGKTSQPEFLRQGLKAVEAEGNDG